MIENNVIWKPVVGWEDQYMVSSLGRVKSLERVVKFGRATRVIKEKILKQIKPGTCEYFQVNLSKNGKQNWVLVHRLVATHFIPNPDNLPYVNHKDENKDHNMIWVNEDGSIDYDKSNLEWCTPSYNNSYSRVQEFLRDNDKTGYNKDNWRQEFLFSHVTSITNGKTELYSKDSLDNNKEVEEDLEIEM